MYDVILVPLDGSKRAEKILPHVAGLVAGRKSRVVLLQVVEPLSSMVTPHDMVPYFDASVHEQLVQEATVYVKSIQETLAAQGIDSLALVEQGPIVRSVLAVAEREEVDLIAMASHGRTGLARVFYGSVAAGILHQADRPLLLIRSLPHVGDDN